MSKYTNASLPSFIAGLDHRLKNNLLASLTAKFHGGVLFHAKRILRVFAIEKTDVRNVEIRDIRRALAGADYDSAQSWMENEAYRNAVGGIELANYFGSLKSAMNMKNLYVGHGERDGDFRVFLEGKKTPWAAIPTDMDEELVPGDNEATRQMAYKLARDNAGFIKSNFDHLDWYASQLERIAAGEVFGAGDDEGEERADAAWGYLSEQYRESLIDALHAKLVELRQTCRAKRQSDEWVGPADYRYIHSVVLKFEQTFYAANHFMSADDAAVERMLAEAMVKKEAELREELKRRLFLEKAPVPTGGVGPSAPAVTGGDNRTTTKVKRAPKPTKAEKDLAALVAAQKADDNNVIESEFGVDASDLDALNG